MAKQYIQGITIDFYIDFKQNQSELLVEYRAEKSTHSTNNAL